MTRLFAILASVLVVVLLGVGVAYVLLPRADQDLFAQCREGQVAGGDIGGPFELLDKDGQTVTDADVITGPSLLYFGYTFCPDVCPLDNSRNVEAVDILDERGIAVTPIFISIDPERDTPEVVGEFAFNLHDRMIGLTGSPEQVKAASQAYKTYYKAHSDKDDPYYLVDHTTMTYLVFPEHGFVDFFRRDVSPQQMADRVACFVDATGGM
ncbi:SCO family protein [Fluviibacterium sp. DFM31]|uniref:SCO family protein n=1 Tax=Meridianimarinicoccus marinus TaxID=3231483 RepID=A0ABV3L0V0_9RHOB